jgi:chromosome segregation ATPase
MSSFGKSVGSLLPEDIEARLNQVQETISTLEGKIISLTKEVESKKVELENISSKVLDATADYNNKVSLSEKISLELKDRETKISQKESALDVYANALKEKEEKINKYLNVFEKMRDVVNK